MTSDPRPEISLEPAAGWHCSHLFYRFDRARLRELSPAERKDGCRQFADVLDPESEQAPTRLQTTIVSGQKADFGLIAMDPNPLIVDGLHQRLVAGPLGSALIAAGSFVSMTEVSEYLPSVEAFGQRLVTEGEDPQGDSYREKVEKYARRLQIMRRQRLTPDLSSWPAVCFYPMSKRREPEANWFLTEFAERERLMLEHGASGMAFAGRVTQLVPVGIGLDDWEWGVTLWARNPEFLKDIVYRMRFDEASARYVNFGTFYIGYQSPADEILRHCRVVAPG